MRTDERLPSHVRWVDTDLVSEGDSIVALGYPLPALEFTVSPGSILSFESVGGVRIRIRSDAQIDRGNSGGPALTESGRVAGIVSAIDPNWDGLQIVPLVNSTDYVRPVVDQVLESPSLPTPECSQLEPAEQPAPRPPVELPEDGLWTVILASLPVGEYTEVEAWDRAAAFENMGFASSVLLSDLFPSLNPGYWVVFTGDFEEGPDAGAYCEAIKPQVGDCYPRWVEFAESFGD